jgi:hypothetical protein
MVFWDGPHLCHEALDSIAFKRRPGCSHKSIKQYQLSEPQLSIHKTHLLLILRGKVHTTMPPHNAPTRRDTGLSYVSRFSIGRRRTTQDSAAASSLSRETSSAKSFEQFLTAYNIGWDKLYNWLTTRFPEEPPERFIKDVCTMFG